MLARVIVCTLCATTLVSCQSERALSSANAPPDFSLSLTVLPESSPNSANAPAWFLLDADGSLRARLGARKPMSPIPPIVRTLTLEERSRLWALAGEAGAGLDAPVRGALGSEESALRSSPTDAILLFWQGGGVRATSICRSGDDPARRGAYGALAAQLRRLAWLDTNTPAP